MLPWVYGFTWEAENLIFLTIFYSVAAIILVTFSVAALRASRDLKSDHIDEIRWHVDFNDLPYYAKACRHVIAGEIESRTCPNGFDCRACDFHAKLVAVKNAPSRLASADDENRESMFGLDMRKDRLYHRGHTWVQKESDGTLTVGLDEFGKRILGRPDAVELPQLGTRMHVNGTGWNFRKGDAKIRVLSPVDGEVIATGGVDADYYLKIRPNAITDLRHLLSGAEVRAWLIREIERLQFMLASEKAGLTLADGGELVKDLPENYPNVNWDGVLGEMFLQP